MRRRLLAYFHKNSPLAAKERRQMPLDNTNDIKKAIIAAKTRREQILLIEDHPVNRAMIKKLLAEQYDILEAENGQTALELLQGEYQSIDGIILDLVMPVMDGITFLQAFSKVEAYANIPVVVTTAAQEEEQERECLRLGAWDFIRKPVNGALLRLRLANVLGRSQNVQTKQMRHMAEHDPLTDLYNRSRFLSLVRELLDTQAEENSFVLLHMDIKRFRLVNTLFGTAAGDELLRFIAGQLNLLFQDMPCAICGRMEADAFGVCAPLSDAQIHEMASHIQSLLASYKPNYYLEPAFGAYRIEDGTLSVETMYDHAAEAAMLVKDTYQSPVAFYQSTMSEAVILEQRIMSEAQAALDSEQFEVYFQPKYDLARQRPYGAEALACWKHPTRGMISPGAFIPVFEKNGFIGKLDFYIWEHTCRLLRKWLDEGRNPAPVSVNISRVNMYNPRLVTIIKALVRKYSLPPSLLNLELTESAYMDNPVQMKKTVKGLQKAGFLIMLDDFGSGYSSLNTLKDMPIDVLKVDMRFLPTGRNDSRSERILASVIRMAGWLELEVIVEGVETKEQLNFLESVGCGYVQGFYFAKPMPAAEYEQFLQAQAAEPMLARLKPERNQRLLELIWSSSQGLDKLFDSLMEPIAIFEYGNGICDPVRVNAAFREVFGGARQSLREQISSTISQEDAQRVLEAFRSAAENKIDAQVEYVRHTLSDTQTCYRLRLRYIQDSGNGVLLMTVFTELTNEKHRKTTPSREPETT